MTALIAELSNPSFHVRNSLGAHTTSQTSNVVATAGPIINAVPIIRSIPCPSKKFQQKSARTSCKQSNSLSHEGKAPTQRPKSILPAVFPFIKATEAICEIKMDAEKDIYVKFLEKIILQKPGDPDGVEEIIKELGNIIEGNKTLSEQRIENELLRIAIDAFQDRVVLLCKKQKSKTLCPGGIERNFSQVMYDAAQKNLFNYRRTYSCALTEEEITQSDDDDIADEVEEEIQIALAENELCIFEKWQYRGINKVKSPEEFAKSLFENERAWALFIAQNSNGTAMQKEAIFKERYDEEALLKAYMSDRRFIDACDVPSKYQSDSSDKT